MCKYTSTYYKLLECVFEAKRWLCSPSSCVCICKRERKTSCDRDLWKFRRQQRGVGWNAGSGLDVLNAHPNTRGHGEWGVTVVGSVQRWSNSPLDAALRDWARLCAGPFEPTPCKGQQNKMKNHNMVSKARIQHSQRACIQNSVRVRSCVCVLACMLVRFWCHISLWQQI